MRWFLGFSLCVVFLLPACGGGGDETCSPNATVACVCVNGLSGLQECNTEGTGFKTGCQCSDTDTTDSDVVGSDATTPDATTPPEDTAQECTPGTSWCEGDVVNICQADQSVTETDCEAEGMTCAMDPALFDVANCVAISTDCSKVTILESLFNRPKAGSIAISFAVDTCEGEPVVGLNISNFQVLEDDSPISTTESSVVLLTRDTEIFISIVLDNSPSMVSSGAATEAVTAAKSFVSKVLAEADSNHVYFSVAFFSKNWTLAQDFTQDIEELHLAIDGLLGDTSGFNTTNLYGALMESLSHNDSAQTTHIEISNNGALTLGQIVIFTDGSDEAGAVALDNIIATVSSTDNDIITMSVGGDVDVEVLTQLGKNGSYLAEDASGLETAFDEAALRVKNLQNRVYLLGYCSPKIAGEHQLKIQLSDGSGESNAITFDADPFDVEDPSLTCSSSAFEEACAGKQCGGLACGVCSPNAVCLDDDSGCCSNFTGPNCSECSGNWEGENCDICSANWTGPNCDQGWE